MLGKLRLLPYLERLLWFFLIDSNCNDAEHLGDDPGVYLWFLSDAPIYFILHGNVFVENFLLFFGNKK